MQTTTVEGKAVSVGDYVGFKCDIEQYGRIVNIKKNYAGQIVLLLENLDGFDGDYIGGMTRTIELASDCWVD